jgi:hypothetical protein
VWELRISRCGFDVGIFAWAAAYVAERHYAQRLENVIERTRAAPDGLVRRKGSRHVEAAAIILGLGGTSGLKSASIDDGLQAAIQ